MSPDQVTFRYVKSPDHRTVYADGVFGGLTPTLNVRMGFFTHYREQPESVTYKPEAGRLTEVKRSGSEGFVRELHTDVLLSVEAAQNLYKWLGEKIEEAKQVKGDPGAMVALEDGPEIKS
jgi:hypothetical protein